MPIPEGHAVVVTPIYVDPSPIVLANENTDNLIFVDDKPFSGPDGLHTDVFLRKLLSCLECFPDVMPLTTVTFLPKSLTRRYGKLATTVLDWWLKEAVSVNNGLQAKSATLFLKIFDFIVMRECPDSDKRKLLHEKPLKKQYNISKLSKPRI